MPEPYFTPDHEGVGCFARHGPLFSEPYWGCFGLILGFINMPTEGRRFSPRSSVLWEIAQSVSHEARWLGQPAFRCESGSSFLLSSSRHSLLHNNRASHIRVLMGDTVIAIGARLIESIAKRLTRA